MMAAKTAVWPGTDEQIKRLAAAIDHNCTCEKATIINPNPPRCPAHQMLLDQQSLNRFAFVGRRAQQYWFNEFLT